MDAKYITDKIWHNKISIAVVVLVFVTGAFISSVLFARFYSPVDASDPTRMTVQIPANASAEDIAKILKEKGLIRSETAFLHYCKTSGVDSLLKAGIYSISRSDSVQDIAGKIASGETAHITITVPEGYTVDLIGSMLVKDGLCSESEWQQAVRKKYDYSFLDEAPGDVKYEIEGFLYPDTYEVPADMKAEDIIKMMLDRFEEIWIADFEQDALQNGRELWVAVTEASLIEKEAALDKERATIAGVICNRLNQNMKLQFCSSVIYSMEVPKTVVTYSDLEIDSPYNTYKYKGLPPGPISSPGHKSIEAAIHPEKHDYLFFVATGNGSHTFSRTYEEHVAAQNN